MTETGNFYYGEDKIHYEVVRKDTKNKSRSDTLINEKSKPRKVVIKVPVSYTHLRAHET